MDILSGMLPWCLLIAPIILFFWFAARRFNTARKKSQSLIDRQQKAWRSHRVSYQCIKEWAREDRDELVRLELASMDYNRLQIRAERFNFASKGLLSVWVQAFFFLLIFHVSFVAFAVTIGWLDSSASILPLVLDTAGRGAFFDLMESYNLGFHQTDPSAKTLLFNSHIFVFRSAWSVVSGALIFLVLAAKHDVLCLARYFFLEKNKPAPMSLDQQADILDPGRMVLADHLECDEKELDVRMRLGFDTDRVRKRIAQINSKIASA
ncbi:MAG: hypothetical protein RH945_08220 [Hyphomonas sp.]